MTTYELKDTSIPSNADKILTTEKLTLMPAAYIPMAADVFFKAIAEIMKETKNKKRPTAFCVDDMSGNMIFAAKVEYEPGEDNNEDGGNWTYIYTFNKTDLPENTHIIRLTDTLVFPFINNIAHHDYNFTFDKHELMVNVLTVLTECIYHWLADNASESDEVAIDINGNELKSSIVNGEIVRSATPSDEMRTAIKSDKDIES